MKHSIPTLPSEAPSLVSEATTLWLIRHAEVESRYQRLFGGRVDMDISPLGKDQARVLASYLSRHRFDAVFSSPMKRVQQTLAPWLVDGAPPQTIIPEFREVDFGDWTGLSWDEVKTKYGVSAFSWIDQLEKGAIPNCETTGMLQARVEPPLRNILTQHAGKKIAIACHGGVIRMMLSILLDIAVTRMALVEIEYTSITQLVWQPGRARLELLNFTPWRDLA